MSMDFRAYTAAHAAQELISRVEEIASSCPETISTRHDGILHDRQTVLCNRFEANISVDARKWHWIKSKIGVFDQRFGTGALICGDEQALLELFRDEDREYRWYRVAANWKMNRLRPSEDAHWFPLTDHFLTELLTRETAASERPNGVLVMK